MRLLFFGDVVGRAGRGALCGQLPALRRRLAPDLIVANGENAAHGFGITGKVAREMFDAGVDVITLGNHAWDQKEALGFIQEEKRLLRPENFPAGTPGAGHGVFQTRTGKRVLVLLLEGRLYTDSLIDDPFAAADRVLGGHPLKRAVDAAVVDMHAETTAEKMAMGHFLDGRAALVAGTHTHVPTADHQVLPGGTAYVTDVGMCGDYDSVIGMKKEAAVLRFTRKIPGERLAPAEGEATVCGTVVEVDDATGLATAIHPLRLGGRLLSAG